MSKIVIRVPDVNYTVDDVVTDIEDLSACVVAPNAEPQAVAVTYDTQFIENFTTQYDVFNSDGIIATGVETSDGEDIADDVPVDDSDDGSDEA